MSPRPAHPDERAQVTPLVVGFVVIGLLLLAAVVDASAAYLRRAELANLADGAALAAADGVQGAQVYDGGLGPDAPVDADAARAYVAAYLAEAGQADLTWSVTQEGDEVVVRLRGGLDLPLTPPGWLEDTTVAAESSVLVRVS